MTDFTYEFPPNQQGEDGQAMGEYINRQMLKVSNAVEQLSDEASGAVAGPETSVVDNVVSFANTTGDEIKDSGIASANVVRNTGGTVTDGNLAVFDGTDGRKIKDGGAASGGGGEPRNYLRNTDLAIFQKGELIEDIFDNDTPIDAYEWFETNFVAGFRVRFVSHDRLSSSTYRPVPGTARFLQVRILTGDTSVPSTARAGITQHIEGQDIVPLMFGSSNAQDIYLSFYFRTNNAPGDFVVSLQNRDRTRTFVHKFNVPTANVWQLVQFPIAGDTTGTWEDPNNRYDQGLSVIWPFAVGATYQSSTFDQWNNDNRFGATGMQQTYQAGYTIDLSSPFLHVGKSAAPYAARNIADDWQLNARYYQTSRTRNERLTTNSVVGQRYKFASDNGDIRDHVMFENCMRDTPTVSVRDPVTGAAGIRYNGSTVTPTILNENQHSFALSYASNSQNATVEYHWEADATMKSFW